MSFATAWFLVVTAVMAFFGADAGVLYTMLIITAFLGLIDVVDWAVQAWATHRLERLQHELEARRGER